MKLHGEWWRTGELGVPNRGYNCFGSRVFSMVPRPRFFRLEGIFVAPGVMMGSKRLLFYNLAGMVINLIVEVYISIIRIPMDSLLMGG